MAQVSNIIPISKDNQADVISTGQLIRKELRPFLNFHGTTPKIQKLTFELLPNSTSSAGSKLLRLMSRSTAAAMSRHVL